MIFHVITTFPDLVQAVFEHGVVRRAVEAGIVEPNIVNLRDFTTDLHQTTDDAPYGGGPGMVMLAEPIFKAVEAIRERHGPAPLIYLSPSGARFTHHIALELAAFGGTDDQPAREAGQAPEPHLTGLILLCGRYEGVDQRVIDHLVNRELSIGDYVLSGGELAAMVVIDAVTRLLPGVLGNEASAGAESFATGLLDWPHYTRPEVFRGMRVPEVLLSGHHGKISGFREEAALLLTYARRPDMLTAEQLERARNILAQRRLEGKDNADAD